MRYQPGAQNSPDRAAIIAAACEHVACGDVDQARELIRREYPFAVVERAGRAYTKLQMTRIFARDGFIDRYSGDRLVYPPVLRLLSGLMPEEFPFHPHGKMDRCHVAHWTLFPSIDHVVPVARGGADEESNWVTTSMQRNLAKGQATLDELGWTLHSPGDLGEWDGLMTWFCGHVRACPQLLEQIPGLKAWCRPAEVVLAEHGR